MEDKDKRPFLKYAQENDINSDRQATYDQDNYGGYRNTSEKNVKYKQVNTDG